MRRSVLLLLCLAIGAVAAVSFAVKRSRPGTAVRRGIDLPARLAAANLKFHSEVRPLLQEYCWDCHGDGADKGGVSLDAFTNATQVFQQRALWERVLDNVRTGAMPPAKKKQPEEAKRQQLMAWLDHVLYPIDPDNPDPGRVTVRRLNRTEYNNTVRDLLGVEFQPAADFPQDDVGYGFDNIGDVLSMPPVLLEKYLGAAQTLMDEVLPTGPPKPPSRLFGPAQIQGHDHVGELYALVDGDREVFVDFPARQPGDYLFQVTAFGKQLPDRITKERVKMAFRLGTEVLATNEVAAKSENPRNYEIRVSLPAGTNRFRVAFVNDREEVEVKQETRPGGRVANITNKFDRDLCVNSIRVTGPFTEVFPPTPFQQWLLGVGPSLGSLSQAPETPEAVLERFASRAFRRPATREEVQRLVDFYRVARAEQPYIPALRHALTAVLVSPHFLFRGELQPEPDNPRAIHPINEYALAARLSYFLWSSMPDETLTDLAARGQLRAGLPGEIRRLLRDPKSRALTDNFAGQWLQLRLLDLASPDKVKFPDFDEYLRHSMLTETEMLFDQIVRQDRPVTDFLTADYTFVNERLARHYGLADVKGNEFRQVSLAGSPRGGVLTHASFLTFSSNPTRTSPVKRGKWVLDNLLGMPPPPPPPNVPELGERNLKGTLRQRLEEHRDNAMCASCHARMDPIGFALEHFDAVGRYREKDGENAIDSADKLHTGETFQDHRDLRKILATAHAQDFARTLSEKLLTYALGRGLEWYDRPTLQQLQTRLARSEYRFSELVIAIAESTPFQRRRGEGDPLADPVVGQNRADVGGRLPVVGQSEGKVPVGRGGWASKNRFARTRFGCLCCRLVRPATAVCIFENTSMPLTHTRDLFAKALKGKYALGAFNVNNMELLQAIIEACEEEKAPVMLQISRGARDYAHPVYLKGLIDSAVKLSTIPIAVHLDHGDTFELCKQCIDEGFTSVMIDASHEPFDKNVEITRKVVEYAHKHNCVVESELGHLVGAQFDDGEEGGNYSLGGHYTHPEEAVTFVKESGCDSLAVAIGNSHGAYKFKGEQHLDLQRLKDIKKALMDAGMGDYPLVLHGASSVPKDLAQKINMYGGGMGEDTAGVPEADIEVARRTGCTKVNIDTDLRLAMTAAIREVLWTKPKEFDPRKYLGPARKAVKELVRHKLRNVLCCSGHAFD